MAEAQGAVTGHLPGCRWSWDGTPCACLGVLRPSPENNHPLFGLAKSEGFELVIDDHAPDRPDILGLPQRDELCAQACKGNIIAIRPSLPLDNAYYAVSHEIAEVRTDFRGHNQLLWREQCTILARWCRKLGVPVI